MTWTVSSLKSQKQILKKKLCVWLPTQKTVEQRFFFWTALYFPPAPSPPPPLRHSSFISLLEFVNIFVFFVLNFFHNPTFSLLSLSPLNLSSLCTPLNGGLMTPSWQSPCCVGLNCSSFPLLPSLSTSFFNFPSHLLSPISMSLFVCPSPSPALLISHNLYLFSFLFSRGGSRKLWRVQSSGRGSEEHWSWQLLVHEQTVGRNPGKHVWEKM